MKTPIALTDEHIINSVNTLFETKFNNIKFLPIGESSWIYIAESANDQKSVIKIQKKINQASTEILNGLSYSNFGWIPKTIYSKDNTMWVKQNNLYFSVQQYIKSEILHEANSKPDNNLLIELGRFLKDLHVVTLAPEKITQVPTDDFNPKIVDLARDTIDRLTHAKPTGTIKTVQDCLQGKSSQIERIFNNITSYGAVLIHEKNHLSIVHGDLHFGNIIQPLNSHCYVVDWDQTMLALREHDLMYFDDEQIAQLSIGYGEDLNVNRVAIQYYRNYLMIRAIWFWLISC